MNINIINNYSKVKLSLFIVPTFFLIAIVVFLYKEDALYADRYVQIQKDCFFFLNSKLSQFPDTLLNLTQLGNEIVVLSILSIFIIYAPKIWECLISASLVSCIISISLKRIFSVPRPSMVFDNNSFVIIGKKLTGYSSLPSGHSITVFTVLTVLLFAFMPQRLKNKILWFIFIIVAGLILVFTRVGVGAHYPLDVIIGGTIGYISGLLGILINEKYKIWTWVNNKKYYPIIIGLFLICGISLVSRILSENLIIFYLSLITLVISLYKTINVYVKK
ncbi:MAG: phosphatase PAP2 family protein [Candidatus Pedobacter colombiensis]|uniref:Phosphatase PAP2 family protein n=1 Tax=Candidatus Pedobacter colombiensis TaxID=3121371 RepID=A0AAJ5WAH6_9SPHI|nr:phosphatase PAP2 family protein [Pedobacter sp.]WEK21022.1 MAG: phosphatase PAP2 family protein [Pedobacter sp.]